MFESMAYDHPLAHVWPKELVDRNGILHYVHDEDQLAVLRHKSDNTTNNFNVLAKLSIGNLKDATSKHAKEHANGWRHADDVPWIESTSGEVKYVFDTVNMFMMNELGLEATASNVANFRKMLKGHRSFGEWQRMGGQNPSRPPAWRKMMEARGMPPVPFRRSSHGSSAEEISDELAIICAVCSPEEETIEALRSRVAELEDAAKNAAPFSAEDRAALLSDARLQFEAEWREQARRGAESPRKTALIAASLSSRTPGTEFSFQHSNGMAVTAMRHVKATTLTPAARTQRARVTEYSATRNLIAAGNEGELLRRDARKNHALYESAGVLCERKLSVEQTASILNELSGNLGEQVCAACSRHVAGRPVACACSCKPVKNRRLECRNSSLCQRNLTQITDERLVIHACCGALSAVFHTVRYPYICYVYTYFRDGRHPSTVYTRRFAPHYRSTVLKCQQDVK